MKINADQTGVVLVPDENDHTYKIKDSKQVLIHKNDKKHTFIYVKSVTRIEEILATQSV